MRVETDEPQVVERVAALDVGTAEGVCCARVPGAPVVRAHTCTGPYRNMYQLVHVDE